MIIKSVFGLWPAFLFSQISERIYPIFILEDVNMRLGFLIP